VTQKYQKSALSADLVAHSITSVFLGENECIYLAALIISRAQQKLRSSTPMLITLLFDL